MDKGIADPIQRELIRLRSYHIFQVFWNTISEIDHQEQHKCKNYLDKNIIDTDLLVILTIYSTIAHIVVFHKYMFREKKNKLAIVSKWSIYIFFIIKCITEEKFFFFTVSKSMKYSYLSKINFTYSYHKVHRCFTFSYEDLG